MTGISYVNLSAQWEDEKEELLPIIESVLESGQYVGSNEIDSLENEIKQAFEVRHVIALNSGTDALMLSLIAIDVGSGDEVITPPNSFIASTAAISRVGATPVFVDVGSDQNIDPGSIEHFITKKTKVIMPVHLTGRVADMPAIMDIADCYNLQVIEDAAQAFGASLKGRKAGSFSIAAGLSMNPMKVLGGYGEAGVVVTDEEDIYKMLKRLRHAGTTSDPKKRITNECLEVSLNHKMDTINAALLLVAFKHFPKKQKNVTNMTPQ